MRAWLGSAIRLPALETVLRQDLEGSRSMDVGLSEPATCRRPDREGLIRSDGEEQWLPDPLKGRSPCPF